MQKLNSVNSSIPTILETHNLSPQMRALLDELKKVIDKEYDGFIKRLERGEAGKIVDRICEQGKRDKLSNEAIRSCIQFTIGRVISERNLRRLLPEELKHHQMVRDNKKPEFADNGRNSNVWTLQELQQQEALLYSSTTITSLGLIWEIDKRDFAKLEYQTLLQVATYYHDRYIELLHSLSESRRKELAGFMKTIETTQEDR